MDDKTLDDLKAMSEMAINCEKVSEITGLPVSVVLTVVMAYGQMIVEKAKQDDNDGGRTPV